MGLSSGPHGAKALLVDKFADAFQNVKCLKDVRELVGVRRSQTLAVLDGNVMMNAIPASVDSFRGYVTILANQLNDAVQAAAHVVVVFDEPEAMTVAKRNEQRRRDEVRQARVPLCSDDLVATITDDNFSTNDLRAEGCNAKLLMEHRKARPRFFDAVCVVLLRQFREQMTGDARGRSPLTASTAAAPTAALACRATRASSRATTTSGSRCCTAPCPSARATSSSPT